MSQRYSATPYLKMIALSFSISCFLTCMIMFLRDFFTVCRKVDATGQSRRSDVATFSSFYVHFQLPLVLYVTQGHRPNRAFCRYSNCCLIVPRCCRYRNALIRRPQTAIQGVRFHHDVVPFFDRECFWMELFNFLAYTVSSTTDRGVKCCLLAQGVLL